MTDPTSKPSSQPALASLAAARTRELKYYQARVKAPSRLQSAENPPGRLSKGRTAILVIHGIGEQNPYETLDQFARNLYRYLSYEGGISDLRLTPYTVDHNDWNEAFVRLETAADEMDAKDAAQYIDIHEYYWAPATEGKMKYGEVLSWAMRTSWQAIARFAENVKLQQDSNKHEGETDDKELSKRWILMREILRVALLYIPLFAILGAIYWWLLNSALQLSKLFDWKLIAARMSTNHPWLAAGCVLLAAICMALSYIVLKQVWRAFLRWSRQQDPMSSLGWVLWVLIVAALSGWGAWEIKSAYGLHLPFTLQKKDAILVVAFLVGKALQAFLTKFVADVAIYTNADAKAKNYSARQQILTGATRSLTCLLRPQKLVTVNVSTGEQELQSFDYEQVILAGHSLGSVIAYDLINSLCNHERGAPDQIEDKSKAAKISPEELAKITGLVTFGSPLDKVYYFFREAIPEQQSIRAQILSYLYSFRKNKSERDYGIYKFGPYSANELPHCTWFNAWSLADPVSGALHFYAVDKRRQFWYLIPLYAHLSYWEDPRFYDFFARPLLVAAPQDVQFKARAAAV